MLNTLTANFLAAMGDDEREPIQVAVFHFENGDVLISDRDITISGNDYTGLVTNWGDLTTVGAENAVASTMRMNLTLWNGGVLPFSLRFKAEDPVDVFVDVYQTFAGLVEDDFAHIGEFVIQDPITYKEVDSLIDITLVTSNMRYFASVGELLTKDKYPRALESDLNKPINLIVGNAGEVQCLCSSKPPNTFLSGSFLTIPTEIFTYDDLDEKGFTQTGYLQIDSEVMRYNSRTSNSFSIVERGCYKTISVDHSDGAEIVQSSDFNGFYPGFVDYIIGQGPLTSVTDVKINGQTPTNGENYALILDENPAYIRFRSQPTYSEYSKGARRTEEYFDAEAAGNTAIMAEWAYDQENKALGAIIDHDNPKLAIIQKDKAFDDGQIVKIFLRVEHWATKAYKNDDVLVRVNGVNNGAPIGILNKPNEKDIVSLGGQIDLTHGHEHAYGEHHSHYSTDPDFLADTSSHLHGVSTKTVYDVDPERYYYEEYLSTWSTHKRLYVDTSPNAENCLNMRVEWRVVDWGDGYSLEGESSAKVVVGNGTASNGDFDTRASYVDHYDGKGFYIDYYYYGSSNRYIEVQIIKVTVTTDPQTTTAETQPISVQKSVEGSIGNIANSLTTIKAADDVKDLPTGTYADLENILSDNSSRSVEQTFDITPFLESADWDWIQNRIVSLEYSGTIDDVQVVVTNIYFDIEYRQRQIKTTDNITCSAVGSIESRPDSVIQYLLTEKAGLPPEKLGSIYRDLGVWDDTGTWDDGAIWFDGGQESVAPIGALFEVAAAFFDYHGYTLDGVIPGDLSVKDAISKISFQTRSKLTWQSGKAKLSILRKKEDWLIGKDIPYADIQIKSYEVKRSESHKIINKIDLCYLIDRLSEASGSGQYDASANVIDNKSVAKHGTKEDNELWLFDLVRSPEMAEDIADYYLWELGETQTYYKFNTYLKYFDLEKEDYITISSSKFDGLNGLPTSIKEITRVFGNGATNKINLLQLICQVIRHEYILAEESEEVFLEEEIEFEFAFDSELQEDINIQEKVRLQVDLSKVEQANIEESFNSVSEYKLKKAESLTLAETQSYDEEYTAKTEKLTVDDFANVYAEIPFGGGGFGRIPFGSVAIFNEVEDDSLGMDEDYTLFLGTLFEDDADIAEVAVTSDGFGAPTSLSSGFGVTPFGN